MTADRPFPARVLIAPDKFKHTLSAADAGRAMAEGVRRCSRAAGVVEPEIMVRPLADGGEGSHAALRELPGMIERTMELTAADGNLRPVAYLAREENETWHYYLETALVIGLQDEANRARDIEERTSRGPGEWLDRITNAHRPPPGSNARPGPVHFHLFLGGSATSDGGFGLALALGFRFFDERDEPVQEFRNLDRLRLIIAPGPRLFDPPLRVFVYTDVLSPLLGPEGAARRFGPQKGATPAQVERIEERLRRLEASLMIATGRVAYDRTGTGAAGGLALPLLFWPGAMVTVRSGCDFFLEATGVRELLVSRPPDLALTGEGRSDAGTLAGKVPAGLARVCQAAGVPVILCAGQIRGGDRAVLREAGLFAGVFDTTEFCGAVDALPDPANAAERIARSVALGLEKVYFDPRRSPDQPGDYGA